MADKKQLEQLLMSSREDNHCRTWNQWREKDPGAHIDLTGADLETPYLRARSQKGLSWRRMA